MQRVDVCLLVEGAYPYVTGGVSSWVHRLIQGLPEVRFGLLELLPDRAYAQQSRYDIPANVVLRQQIYLFETDARDGVFREPDSSFMAQLSRLHADDATLGCPFVKTIDRLAQTARLGAFQLETARATWQFLTNMYRQRGHDISFIDYVWNWRATHGPVLRLREVPLPAAGIYHSMSTGYAGFLAALARVRGGTRFILTEHGLYTRERDIEIVQADWIYDEWAGRSTRTDEPFFKRWWRRQYRFLGKMAYESADRIVALNGVSHGLQLAAGADPTRCAIIPNGVSLARFRDLRGTRDWRDRPFRVGFIGRVVPIKDVKTFIRAVQLASVARPIAAFVIGPLDEDPGYAQECVTLSEMLNLSDILQFVGAADVRDWLSQLDLVVLTSVSEAQPLVLIEAMASGIPVIGTRVGGCPELIVGREGLDQSFGPSGIVTPVASPQATAAAICELANSPLRYQAMSQAAVRRVEHGYDEQQLFDRYRSMYRELGVSPRKLN